LRDAPKNLDQYRQKKTDFTRNRKLPFKKLCKLLSKLLKKVCRQNSTIFLRMDLLAPNLPCAKPELKPVFFEDLFNTSVQAFYAHHTQAEKFKHYRL